MKITCPQCDMSYIVHDGHISHLGARITCPACTHSFVVDPPQSSKEASVSVPSNISELDFRRAGITWTARQASGITHEFYTLQRLLLLLQDGTITTTDEISRDPDHWTQIDHIEDLEYFFYEVWQQQGGTASLIENASFQNESRDEDTDVPTDVGTHEAAIADAQFAVSSHQQYHSVDFSSEEQFKTSVPDAIVPLDTEDFELSGNENGPVLSRTEETEKKLVAHRTDRVPPSKSTRKLMTPKSKRRAVVGLIFLVLGGAGVLAWKVQTTASLSQVAPNKTDNQTEAPHTSSDRVGETSKEQEAPPTKRAKPILRQTKAIPQAGIKKKNIPLLKQTNTKTAPPTDRPEIPLHKTIQKKSAGSPTASVKTESTSIEKAKTPENVIPIQVPTRTSVSSTPTPAPLVPSLSTEPSPTPEVGANSPSITPSVPEPREVSATPSFDEPSGLQISNNSLSPATLPTPTLPEEPSSPEEDTTSTQDANPNTTDAPGTEE